MLNKHLLKKIYFFLPSKDNNALKTSQREKIAKLE